MSALVAWGTSIVSPIAEMLQFWGSIFDPDTNFLSPTQILGIAIRPGARFSGSIFRFAVISVNLIARFWEAMFDGPNLDFLESNFSNLARLFSLF